ncbi:MAG: 2-oxo acid dehydrogenase subunit E2 [Candidatus Aminicenantes bacterium]|nr:2-oxo acid dehydrogenase subunit E2 [Candidatus Aminicenantes bacterium]
MAKEFRFPDVGEGITEGEIVKWHVKVGDTIKEDQTIAEIETDKAIVEVPSPYSGTVLKLKFNEKDIVKVGKILAVIGDKGESPDKEPEASSVEMETKPAEPAAGIVGEITESKEEIKEIKATPKIRKLALELGINLKAVKGTGPQGRITEEDVHQASGKKQEDGAKKPGAKMKAKFDFYGFLDRIPLRGVRRATAKRMAQSVSKAALVTHFDEADVTELAKIREELKVRAEEKEVKLTFLPFIVKAVISALKAHPILNSTLDEEEEEIIVKKYYNIGIAVDVPDGLIVPVIKLAEHKSLFQLAAEIQSLAGQAKDRSLDMADLKGGTFSITNVGMIGGEYATPIVNYPEVAILATLKIADRPRVAEREIKIKKILPLCLSFDHRVVDGAEVGRFMNDLIHYLENPSLILVDQESNKIE